MSFSGNPGKRTVIGLAEWIMVVDEDVIVLKSAGQILSKNHMRVTGFQTGEALIK